MPFPASIADRKLLHTRRIVCEGYERSDGLFDLEGWLTDTKSYVSSSIERFDIPAGDPFHSMGLRLTVDTTYTIRDAVAAMEATPMSICTEVTPNFSRLVGVQFVSGYRQKVQKLLGGAA